MIRRGGEESEATFVARAGSYVTLLDSLPLALSAALVARVASNLAALYDAALQLPALKATSREPLPPGTDGEGLKMLRSRVNQLFAQYSVYWIVFDPYDEEGPTPVAGDLVDDLVSIYEDLRAGLDAYARGGDHAREAVWDWDFGFKTHWGNHLTGALRALHSIISSHRV